MPEFAGGTEKNRETLLRIAGVPIFIYGSTVRLLDLGRFFSFLMLYTVGRTPWTGDQPVRTRGTICQQLNINAERRRFPHPQILTPEDQFGRNMS
jgi:hypothetical protein